MERIQRSRDGKRGALLTRRFGLDLGLNLTVMSWCLLLSLSGFFLFQCPFWSFNCGGQLRMMVMMMVHGCPKIYY